MKGVESDNYREYKGFHQMNTVVAKASNYVCTNITF